MWTAQSVLIYLYTVLYNSSIKKVQINNHIFIDSAVKMVYVEMQLIMLWEVEQCNLFTLLQNSSNTFVTL